jgi:16S rRNA (uracil1498-N3)-methyltransferase
VNAPGAWPAAADAAAHVFVAALDDECAVEGPDGHHLQRARRLVAGEFVTAADGSGAWRRYEIVESERGRLLLAARGETMVEPAPQIGVVLAIALTKGGIDHAVARVTELGVAGVIPVRCERSVARWDARKAATAVARLRDVAREAAAQSRRARIPEIGDLAGVADLAPVPGVVVADVTGSPARELAWPPGGRWTIVVGPEGGFSPAEVAILAAAPRLRLGPHVLRAETAPVAAAAVVVQRVEELGPPTSLA